MSAELTELLIVKIIIVIIKSDAYQRLWFTRDQLIYQYLYLILFIKMQSRLIKRQITHVKKGFK